MHMKLRVVSDISSYFHKDVKESLNLRSKKKRERTKSGYGGGV